MRNFTLAAAAFAAFTMSTAASAAVVVLDFDGVATTNNVAAVGGFYNGGVSADGNSGTNYGVAFSSNALAINSYNGSGEPNPGILFFLSGGAVTIDYAAGFTTGFSFNYSSNSQASITVYDGLGATGNVLATLNLVNNFQSGCGYCAWDPIGVSFAGIAKSIDFAGGANFVGYDNITFGSATPGIPEPATWAMMIIGFGMVGSALRRRTAVAA
ncbi:PEP-CTERM sorting domain-containing protein [Sandaracinobacteroides saxicola]|uniref:PEP-CTERM sorting domain-containing protein n=2 Tax=Sandaracinobacteroides saxicola TaxID=2759707 RepID=A0A7G5IMJ6_9SPHN|nr:PEP-CTERM sorting domain-containing protein [Sandaracinobacteroides saxicola]